MIQHRREKVIGHTILVVGSLVALYPFVTILALAMSRPGERPIGMALPTSLDFGNFGEAWERGLFASALTSSAIVAVSVVGGTIVLAVPAAYALARSGSKLLAVVAGIFLVGLVMPYEATVIPLYQMFRGWGLLHLRRISILVFFGRVLHKRQLGQDD